MSKWKYTLHVQHIIKNEALSGQKSSQMMAKSLERFCVTHPRFQSDFEGLITEFTELSTLDSDDADVTACFDETLDYLYDLCDFYRIWIPFVK